MIDELYIDGQKMDMGGDSGIYLTYRSNIFSDISKIVGNNSGTIKLPLTANNKAIIDCSFIPSSNSRFPYKSHSASLIRDGLVLLDNATAVLMEESDSEIQIALTWGVTDGLKSFANDGKKIADLSNVYFGADEDLTKLPWTIETATGTYKDKFPIAHYGFSNDETLVTYHPCVLIDSLISQIAKDNELSFSFDSHPWKDVKGVKYWCIPLLERNCKPLDFNIDFQNGQSGFRDATEGSYYREGWKNLMILNPSSDITDEEAEDAGKYLQLLLIEGDYSRVIPSTGEPVDTGVRRATSTHKNVQFNCSGKIHIEGWFADLATAMQTKFTLVAYNFEDDTPSSANMGTLIVDGDLILEVSPSSVVKDDTTTPYGDDEWPYYKIEFDFSGEECDSMEDIGTYVFPMINGLSGKCWVSSNNVDYTISYDDATSTQLEFGDDFWAKENLPDVKQIELVKAIMQMCGMFAFAGEDGKIEFSTFDKLKSNISKAIDWSDCLIQSSPNIAKTLEYSAEDECQHNKMLYKNDDVNESMSSEYVVDNSTLDYTRDAITLPFSAFKDWGGVARFDLYTYSKDDDGNKTIEYDEDNNAYICMNEMDEGGNFYLTNNGIKWNELISSHYSEYVEMLNYAKKITETFKLSSITLKNLDLRIPVYLKQYGAYFGIVEITTKEENMAEVKLIKL